MEEEHMKELQTTSKLLENNINETKKIPAEPLPLLFSKRFLVAIMLFLCYIIFQILKNNMSIAIVEMTSNKSFNSEWNTTQRRPEFEWDSRTIAIVNGIVSYGSLFAFTSGFMVDKFGGSVTCSLCMFLSGTLTILHSAALKQSFYVFLACRILTGFFESVFYSSTSEISARWFPKKERTTLIAFAFNGTNVGVALTYPLCGYLAGTWGWRMAFYVTVKAFGRGVVVVVELHEDTIGRVLIFILRINLPAAIAFFCDNLGAMSVIVALLMQLVVKNHPSQDTWITKKELVYILEQTGETESLETKQQNADKDLKKDRRILKCMLTSGPLWALFSGQFSFMWLSTILCACLPLYIKDMTQKEVDEIGYISAIPNTVHIFMFPIAGALINYWKTHSNFTTTRIHKVMFSLAFVSASIFFTVTVVVSNFIASLIFFILIQIFISIVSLILSIIIINLAPTYTSHVSGLSAIFYSSGTIVAQIVTGFIVENETVQEWNAMFLLTAVISILGALIFVFFGSSETQKWSL